jgi:hypothetical protein
MKAPNKQGRLGKIGKNGGKTNTTKVDATIFENFKQSRDQST